ncbi:MAG: cobalt ECF transporter T component CbiQ [Gaiellaceae bacterium]
MSGLCNHQPGLIGLAGDPASPIHRLDPRAKMLGLLTVTLVAITTPFSLWPVWAACGVVLAGIAALARVPARTIWRRARFVLPLVLFVAIFIPFLRKGGQEWSLGPLTVSEEGLQTLLAVAAKATIGTVSAVILGATTTFPDVLRALEALRVPRLFTLIAAFMYRYLFVIVDEVQRMRAALASRGYRPRWAWQGGAVGRVVAALFLRSYGRGERVYLAMLARGFDGVMPQLNTLAFRRIDGVFVGLVVASLVAVRVALGVAP